MLKNIRSLLIVPAMLVLVLAVVVPAATADRGSSDDNSNAAVAAADNSGSDESGTSGSNDSTGTTTEQSSEAEPLTEDSLSQRTNHMMQSLMAKHKNHQSNAARERKCQAAKHGLETKLGNLQKNAAKHKALIDSIYSKALTYQQQNNINPANFSTLTDAANAAQAQAAASVSTLDSLSVNLDCSSNSVATNVASFKVAAQQARSDLLAYRKAVVAVLQALESAKQQ